MSPELLAKVKSKELIIQLSGTLKDEFATMCEQVGDKHSGDVIRSASVLTGVKDSSTATGMRNWYLGEYIAS